MERTTHSNLRFSAFGVQQEELKIPQYIYKDAVQGGHPPPPIVYLVPMA